MSKKKRKKMKKKRRKTIEIVGWQRATTKDEPKKLDEYPFPLLWGKSIGAEVLYEFLMRRLSTLAADDDDL